jgi:ribose 5-phosphate isomerase B
MRIVVAADHAGFPLKAPILELLRAAGHDAVDLGTGDTTPVDYPDVIAPAAFAVAAHEADLGIVLGGSGTGEQIVANKVPGIRCVEATDPVTARLGREHNDANMLSMGARIVGSEVALACVRAFLEGEFQGGRHARRVAKIRALERSSGLGSQGTPQG